MNKIYKISVLVIISLVIFFAFYIDIPKIGILGDKARIIFLHVPTAWLSVLAFLLSMIYSVQYLRKRDIIFDIKAVSAAEIGFLFSILATVTGSVWAKFSWGSFWNWDPRETSIFILLLIYGAYFSLRSAVDVPEQKAKLSSVYSIIAFVTVPFFVFIMPRIIESLHPDPIINVEGKINMDGKMTSVFFSSLLGFTMLFFWILNIKIRLEKINFKRNQRSEI
ncbi:MAG: cytochrome c biogenesis protein CcsA [Ignavibacteria bacterium]|nr:cytochrome c biogenesis protein CcsA [Ignavibacteria bacterium]